VNAVVWERIAAAVALTAVIAVWCALLARTTRPGPEQPASEFVLPADLVDLADDTWTDPETRLEAPAAWVDPDAPAELVDRRAAA
jgi:hypothetical protein